MIERQHRKHPVAAAEAGDADLFSLEVVRRLDVFRHRKSPDQFVDKSRDEDTVQPVQYGAETRARCGTIVEMRFPRRESGKSDRRARHQHQFHVQFILAEETLVLRDDQQTFPLAETRRRDNDFCRWRAGAKHLSFGTKKKQQANSQDDRHGVLDLTKA